MVSVSAPASRPPGPNTGADTPARSGTRSVRSPAGATVTNAAFRPGTNRLVLTESASGCVLEAELPALGAELYSHG